MSHTIGIKFEEIYTKGKGSNRDGIKPSPRSALQISRGTGQNLFVSMLT